MNAPFFIFPWNDHFSTGIPQIDEQHKMLVSLVNKLAYDVAYGLEAANLERIFGELVEYVYHHFKAEEGLWAECLASDEWEIRHRDEHNEFVDAISSMQGNGRNFLEHKSAEELLSFLTHWLVFHILESDRRLAKAALAMRSGRTIEEAKRESREEMASSTAVLLDSVLAMYDELTGRSMQLIRESAERTRAELKTQSLLKRNNLLMQSTPEGVHIVDEHGRIIEANEAFSRLLGYTPEETLQLTVFDLEANLSREEIEQNLRKPPGAHAKFESMHRRKDGTLVDVEIIFSCAELDGAKCFFVLSRDITERKKAEETIKSLAFYDALTQLPNRRLLHDRLKQSMLLGERHPRFGAVLFLDLDNFKPLNDAHGHGVGDLLLIEAARRISSCVRKMDTVARFGGDEFVVLLSELQGDELSSETKASLVARKILSRLARPYVLPLNPQGRETANLVEHHCTSSIGITLFNGRNNTADDVIKYADLAMYEAKEAGGNAIRVYHHCPDAA